MLPTLHSLADHQRSTRANILLGRTLAFVAGASNAGGFLAVGQYTSHMTGIVSSMMDHLALGQFALMLTGLAALLAFGVGAMLTALLINWARRRRLHSQFALPLLLEAVLLLLFGLMGASMDQHTALRLPVTVLLLCFIMGLQNAVITKITRAEIRTTHITGLITDLGIELGKLLYWNHSPLPGNVRANRDKIRLQASLILLFALGGLLGALGFKHLGYASTLPLAVLLVILTALPLRDDMRLRYRLYRQHHH